MRWRQKTFFLTLSLCLLFMFSFVLTAAAASPTIEDINTKAQLDGQTIRIGIDPFFPPFASLDDDGNVVGFQVALLEAIAQDANFQVEWVVMPINDLFMALESGELDAVVATMIVSSSQAGSAELSNDYYLTTQSVYSSPDVSSDIDGVDDLGGKRIGVIEGSAAEAYVAEIEEVEVSGYGDLDALIEALDDGEIDVIIADTLRSEQLLADDGADMIAIGTPVTEDGYSIVVGSSVNDLLDAINTSLENIVSSHAYNAIYREWFNAPPPSQFHLPAASAETLVNATFAGDLETLATVTCDRYERGENFPTTADMAGADELGFDGIELVYDATVDGDNAQVTISGTFQFLGAEHNATELFDGPFEMRLDDEGWVFCPSNE